MRPDNDMIIRLQKRVKNLFPVAGKDRALSPGRSQQHRLCRFRRFFPCPFSCCLRFLFLFPLQHFIQVGHAGNRQFLLRKVPYLLDFADRGLLKTACEENRVIVIQAEHAVSREVVDPVGNMHIGFHAAGALPLVDIQARRAGEHNVSPDHIHFREGAVSFPRKLRADAGVVCFRKRRVVLGGGQIERRNPPLLKLVADRTEEVPVPLAVRENHDRNPVRLAFLRLSSAGDGELCLHQDIPEGIDQRAENADQDRKEHTARTGIDVEHHSITLQFSGSRTSWFFSM